MSFDYCKKVVDKVQTYVKPHGSITRFEWFNPIKVCSNVKWKVAWQSFNDKAKIDNMSIVGNNFNLVSRC
jgi:phage-related protein